MSKVIHYSSVARTALKKGLDQLANAVKVTLGPQGRTVIIEKEFGLPHATKDGVTVAKQISLPDPVENMGAQMVKEVASKTADVAGDGTTTATVLAQAIYAEGFKNVVAGADPTKLKSGMESAVSDIVEELKLLSRPVKDNDEIAKVGSISANNEPKIGKLIADAMKKVGNEGIITVEESKSTETYVDVVEGMQFDRGFLSPHFVTNPELMKVEMNDPNILIYDGKIMSIQELLPALDISVKTGKPLLIIAEDVEGEALGTLVVNKIKGTLKVSCVKTPGFGDRKKHMLEDIAILTGGHVVTSDTGGSLSKVTEAHFGRCSSISSDKGFTTIVGGKGDSKSIETRVKSLVKQLAEVSNDYEKEKIQERIAKLAGGVAVINVGAASEIEMKEIKDRIDDALHATRAAVAEGIVPGGGVALIRASEILAQETHAGDFQLGMDIIRKAVEAPFRTIVENAGLESSIYLTMIKTEKGSFGFDAKREVYVDDMVEAGIIDPTKVTRVALQNAVSIAGLMLMTEATVTNPPKNEESLK